MNTKAAKEHRKQAAQCLRGYLHERESMLLRGAYWRSYMLHKIQASALGWQRFNGVM